jgi:replicative DNA helicase
MRKITILQANFNKKRFSAEVVARLTAEKINSMKDLVLTGLPFIDKRLNGLTRKSISSLIAKPKHLKSTLVDFMVSTSVEKYNTVGLILSLEDPIEERVKRICASRLEVSLEDMRFKRVSVSEVDILNIFKHNFKNRLYIYDKKDVLTPDDAAMIINEIKPDLVVIDYIQKFVMDDMVLGIIRAVNTLESVAIQNNSNIMVLSQVSDKKIVGREDQAPTASDAQWSSAMYQSSSEMFGLYYPHVHTKNPFDMNILEFNILASRYAHVSGKFKIKVNPDKGFIGDEITHESN